LFGNLDASVAGFSGNIIDVAGGYYRLTVYHARAYGSSGGISD
jgi:hypothetical protein